MRFGSRAPIPPIIDPAAREAETFALANDRLKGDAEIWWPHELFLTSSQDVKSHSVCPAVIDATGRPRHLVFGPFRALAPGRWRASVVLRVSAAAAGRPLAVDFGAEPNFVLDTLPFGAPGLHRIDLENTFTENDHAQFRLWVKRAAFEGEIGFMGVALTFVNAPSSDPTLSKDTV
jgi:hypothetical protein